MTGGASALATTVAGVGPTVVFLHGIGSSRRSFDDQIAALSAHCRCVAIDAPGYADSPDPPADGPCAVDGTPMDPMEWFAWSIERTIGELVPAGEPVGLVGVSFGGVLATRIALRGHVPIGLLVLADTSRGSGVTAEKSAAMRRRPSALAELGARALAARRAPHLLSPAAPAALVEQVTDTMASSIRLPGFSLAAEAMASTDHGDRLSEIGCPTLVVVGDHDAVCPPEESRRLAAAIPSAELSVISGAGHLANIEQPGQFNTILRRSVAAHLRRPDPAPSSRRSQ